MPGPKEKAAFGARRRIRASVLTGVGVSVQAPIWACLRARYHLLRGRDCCPVADGADLVGVVVALICFFFRCRWLSRAGAGAAGG